MLCLALVVTFAATPLRASEEEAIRERIKVLQDKSRSIGERAQAASRLGDYGPKAQAAVPALIEALAGETELRESAAAALAKIGKPAVPLLAKALDSENPTVLTGAAQALRDIGPDAKAAAPRLVKLLGVEDAVTRIAVVEALGSLRDPDSVPALGARVRTDPDFGVRRYAAFALTDLGADAKAAVPDLLDALRQANALSKLDPPPKVPDSDPRSDRENYLNRGVILTGDPVLNLDLAASHALTAIGPPAVPGVVDLLSNKDKGLRRGAVFILADMGAGAKAAAPDLAKRLEDEDPEVRQYTAVALGRIGRDASAAVPALRKAFRDPAPGVRVTAAVAVMRIDPQADGALDVVKEALRHKDAEVRLMAVQTLGPLKPTARPALLALAAAAKDEDAEVRYWAVTWLGKTGRPAEIVVSALEAALKDDSQGVRCKALEYLGEVEGGEKSVPALIRALQDSDETVRKRAAWSLMRHARYAAEAVPDLEKALQDPDEQVRDTAALALKKIKEKQKEKE
jgi:HEAT repeat protein